MNINLTFFAQMVAFAVFVWICMRYLWPPIVEAMSARQARIAEGLESAERASKDLELAHQRAEDQLTEARSEASEIIEQARRRGTQLVEEAQEEARAEGERIKEAARADINQDTNRAREALRADVARLALVGAERILESSVDQNQHQRMLERLSSEL